MNKHQKLCEHKEYARFVRGFYKPAQLLFLGHILEQKARRSVHTTNDDQSGVCVKEGRIEGGERREGYTRKKRAFSLGHTHATSLSHINTHRQWFHMHVYVRAMAYSCTKTPRSSRRKLVRHLFRQSKRFSAYSMSPRQTLWNWYKCDDFVTSSHHFSSI